MAKSLDQIRSEQKKKKNSQQGIFQRLIGSKIPKNGSATSQNSAQKGKKGTPQPELTLGEHALSWLKTLAGAIVMVMILNGLLIASFVVPTGSMENTVMTGDFLFVNKFIYGPSTPQMIPLLNIPLPYYRFPGIREPQKGDVIVFIFPGNREEAKPAEFQYYLKRCVATAGDVLEIKNKEIYVNGQKSAVPPHSFYDSQTFQHPEDRVRTFPFGAGFSKDNYGPLRIPKKGDVIKLTADNFTQWEIFIEREGHIAALENGLVQIDGTSAQEYVVQRDYCFGIGDNRDNSEDSRYWGFIPVENVVGTPLIVYWSWDTNYVGSSYVDSMIGKLKSIRFNRIFKIIE